MGEVFVFGCAQKCTLCMCKHVHPNVANERDPGRLRGAHASIEAVSLSQHRALIFPPPAASSSSSSSRTSSNLSTACT